MNAPHELRAHARLSASSSDRWLNCTAAPTLEAAFADERSEFAAEGTRAHELAEKALLAGRDAQDITGDYPADMREYVQVYLDYVRAVPGELLVEQRFDLTKWVPEGFGTSDAIVLRDGVCYCIDLKYGKGLKVDAERNTQLMLYALGAYDAYDAIYGPITTVKIVVAQPRLDHFDEWELSADELLAWGESIKPIARIAFDGPGEAKAGDHCQFCKARHTCRARAEIHLAIARDEMGEYCPPSTALSDDELAEIYPKLAGLVKWANDLESYCLVRAEQGTHFKGLKLVEGRSVRKVADETALIDALRAKGLDDYEFMTMKLAGVTALEKLMGKTEFAAFVTKPAGAPTLVPDSDKRPALVVQAHAIAEMVNS